MDKKYLFSIIFTLLFTILTAMAEEGINERVFVHTDKDCYVAGEDIWIKFHTVDQNFQPSFLSKVGYVEISDNLKPWIQLKLALEGGSGAGRLEIPLNIPSGIYQLSGYTRYMRNEGENIFFKRQIAIINAGSQPDPNKVEVIEPTENTSSIQNESSILIKTDKSEYSTRNPVRLSVDNLPEDIQDLVVSVYRDDSVISPMKVNKGNWEKQIIPNSPSRLPLQWDAEYEGHIIEGRIVPEPQRDKDILSSVSFVGNDIKYIEGKVNPDNGSVSFYTSEAYGPREIVTTIASNTFEKIPGRIDIVTPFCEILPDSLPPLRIVLNEKQLLDRYIGVQLKSLPETDSLSDKISSKSYYNLPVAYSYDLDEYTRFNTIDETLLEFVDYARTARAGNKKRFSIYLKDKKHFTRDNLLTFLDGVPIYDHENLLNYNPQYIKRINIYDRQYIFGGHTFEGMISFITRQGNLPFFQLDSNSQLFIYDFPKLAEKFNIPDYSEGNIRISRKPDFRHTLYWNPFIENIPEKNMNVLFYTSDLGGKFIVKIEGITRKGEIVSGSSYFEVNE